MEKDGVLKYPHHRRQRRQDQAPVRQPLRHGQSTIDGIIRATNVLLAGKDFVVAATAGAAAGWPCGPRGMGANVIVTEVDPLQGPRGRHGRLPGHAHGRGRRRSATSSSPLTGDINVIRQGALSKMKDGAIVANSGHFNVEIDLDGAGEDSRRARDTIREFVEEYTAEERHGASTCSARDGSSTWPPPRATPPASWT